MAGWYVAIRPLADLLRFPSAVAVAGAVADNARHLDALHARATFGSPRRDYWAAALTDCLARRSAWLALWDSQNPAGWNKSLAYRASRLVDLRTLIGPDAYYSGRMPPPVNLDYLEDR